MKKNGATLLLLGAFLFGFGLWSALRPADAFSESERRQLTPRPQLSVQSVLSGKYMSEYENYALDQFPLRDEWRTLKAATSFYVLRQKDNNGVYLADGYASRLEYPMNEASVDRAAERFQYLYDTYFAESDVKLYLSVVPDKNAFLARPNGYPAIDYDAFIARVREKTPEFTYVDITDLLSLEDYYRTDLHWRQEQIVDVAQRLADAMRVQSSDAYTQQTLERPYYGVYYGYAALPLPSEQIRYLTSETLERCTVYNFETDSEGGVYDMEKAAGKDPYELFLSGSVSLLRIENPDAQTDRELVIFRDSFASSLAPLLVEGYAKITLVDIRYLSSQLLGRYLSFTDQDVLLLYSVGVLNNSDTLK